MTSGGEKFMIISASRRTDIPAFYAEWFLNRVRAGYCTVLNPFNRNQISRVSLDPDNVDMIVFWTRNPRPLFPHLEELEERGLDFYFQYTLIGNPRCLDPKSPSLNAAVKTFQELADRIGPERVIWRYDPMVFSSAIPVERHRTQFARLADTLAGRTRRVVVSIMDDYAKTHKRMAELAEQGVTRYSPQDLPAGKFESLMRFLADTAAAHAMEITSCAEVIDLTSFGIRPGKCVDDDYIRRVFGKEVVHKKDPSQREECGCVASRDIGVYDTCLYGCRYCYATRSFETARKNHAKHDPLSPSLVGWYDKDDEEHRQLRLL